MVRARDSIRWIPALLGAWLIVSALVWRSAPTSMHGVWVLGVLLVSFGVVSAYEPWAEIANVTLALALVVATTMTMGLATLAVANNLLVAAALFAVTAADPRWRRELS